LRSDLSSYSSILPSSSVITSDLRYSDFNAYLAVILFFGLASNIYLINSTASGGTISNAAFLKLILASLFYYTIVL